MNKSAGESHEVMPGTGVPPTVPAGDAPPEGGGGGGGDRLTPAELAVLEEAEKAAAKRAKKAGRKARGYPLPAPAAQSTTCYLPKGHAGLRWRLNLINSLCILLMVSVPRHAAMRPQPESTQIYCRHDVLAAHLCAALSTAHASSICSRKQLQKVMFANTRGSTRAPCSCQTRWILRDFI